MTQKTRYDAKNTLKTGKGHHSVILSVGRRLLRRCCSVRWMRTSCRCTRFAILLPSVADFHGANGDSGLRGPCLRMENLVFDRQGQGVFFNQCKAFPSGFTSGAYDNGLFLCRQYRFLSVEHESSGGVYGELCIDVYRRFHRGCRGDSIVFVTQGSGFAGRKRFDDLRGDGYG